MRPVWTMHSLTSDPCCWCSGCTDNCTLISWTLRVLMFPRKVQVYRCRFSSGRREQPSCCGSVNALLHFAHPGVSTKLSVSEEPINQRTAKYLLCQATVKVPVSNRDGEPSKSTTYVIMFKLMKHTCLSVSSTSRLALVCAHTTAKGRYLGWHKDEGRNPFLSMFEEVPERTISRNFVKVLFRHHLNVHRHAVIHQSTDCFISNFSLVVKTIRLS